MGPRPQLRFFTPHQDNVSTRLNLTQTVTILFIDISDDAIELNLPLPPHMTTLTNVDLSTLLSLDFLGCNVSPSSPHTNHTSLVGYVEQKNPAHALCATLLPREMVVSVPSCQVSSLGLFMNKSSKHARNLGLPSYTSIAYDHKAQVERARWALSADRVGRAEQVHLSCGRALVKVPMQHDGQVRQRTMKPKIEDFVVEADKGMVCSSWVQHVVTQGNDVEEAVALVEHIQWLSCDVREKVMAPEMTPEMISEMARDNTTNVKVKRVVYEGVCNGSLMAAGVQCVKEVLKKSEGGVKWGVVMGRAPEAHGVWQTGTKGRTGEKGFMLDAAEMFVIVKNKTVVAQLCAPCDAL